MRPPGGRRAARAPLALLAAAVALAVGAATAPPAAMALDLFTLWREPQIPLRLETGAWAEYRSVTLEAGQRREELLRLQCVGRTGDSGGAWRIELVPLVEAGQARTPAPGEGVAFELDDRVRRREGRLADLVGRVTRWRDGRATTLAAEEWREEPLVAASLGADFAAERVDTGGPTTRVVEGRSLLCRQLTLTADDTLRVALPRGTLVQVRTREISAAVHPDVPFLGLAFAAERTVAAGKVEPPSPRRADPPPSVRVDSLELLAFGGGARPLLGLDRP